MKKLIGLSLVLLAALNLTANGNQDVQTTSSGTKEGIAAYEPDPGKNYTLSWVGYQMTPLAEDAEMISYWEDKYNVTFDVWNIENNKWDELLNLKFASGEVPDVVRITDYTRLKKYYDQQLLAEIPDEVLQTYGSDIIERINEAGENFLPYSKIEGKLYAFPREFSANNLFHRPVVYRGDWLDNLNLEVPDTLEEFEKVMYAFTKDDPDGNGKNDTYGLSQSGFLSVYGAFGYQPERNFWQFKGDELVYAAVQPEMKEALAMLSKWYEDEVIDPEFITGENAGGYWAISHSFANSRIGFTSHANFYHWIPPLFEGSEVVGTIAEFLKINEDAALQLKHGLPPVGPGGNRGIQQGNLFNGFTGFGFQLEEEKDKMGKAIKLINDMSAADYETYLNVFNGIEDKHFIRDDRGNVGWKEGIDAKYLSSIGAHNVIQGINPLEFNKRYYQWRVDWASEQRYDEYGMSNALLSTLPSSPKYQAELDKIMEETYLMIISGQRDLDYFDDFVEQWYASGGSVLVEEANAWYDSVK